MCKVAARNNGNNRQFKHKIYQSRRRGQSRNFYDSHNYDRGNYQNRYRSNSRDRRIQFSGQSRVDQGMNKIIGYDILEAM